MDSKSLMIGDWVNWKKGNMLTPCKIGIGDLMYVEENAVAIPLTAEILEKNGWKRDIDKEWRYNNSHILPRYCYQWERQNVKIEIDEGLDGFTTNLIIGRRFYAVHELQHALRLCGLNDLADNFQILEDD